jgi:hypothetical protein
MSLQSTLNAFNFYQKYVWQPADFANFQGFLLNTIGLLSGGNSKIISGCQASAGGGLNVSIAPGVVINNDGYPMYIPTTQTVAMASPVTYPCLSLIVARPLLTNVNPIPQPTNPSNTVYLNTTQGFQLVAINGTPSATPVAPAILDGDVIVAELSLTAAISTITSANFLFDLVQIAGKSPRNIKTVAANYTCTGTEDVLEVSASGGAVSIQLAAAASIPGGGPEIIKIDSSANLVNILASEGISGQTTIGLDSQWGVARILSNGQAYRQLV